MERINAANGISQSRSSIIHSINSQWMRKYPSRFRSHAGASLAPSEIKGPGEWGPMIWPFVHLASSLPMGIMGSLVDWVRSYINPKKSPHGCAECSFHFEQYIKQNGLPKPGEERSWALGAHNSVNARTGKPQWTMPMIVERYGK